MTTDADVIAAGNAFEAASAQIAQIQASLSGLQTQINQIRSTAQSLQTQLGVAQANYLTAKQSLRTALQGLP